MDFDLTKDQQLLMNSARDFLKKEGGTILIREMEKDERGYLPEHWQKMADLGWLGVVIPEQYGGLGEEV